MNKVALPNNTLKLVYVILHRKNGNIKNNT